MVSALVGERTEASVKTSDSNVAALALSTPSTSHLVIALPAVLAAAAHVSGEDSELLTYCTARALDARGAGRVPLDLLRHRLAAVYSDRQVRRVLGQPCRYFEVDRQFLRLCGQGAIIESLSGEVLFTRGSRSFPLPLLNTRPRRSAAIVSAALAGVDAPRSNAFLSRFVGVDRKTISRWLRDPVIREHILARAPSWAVRQ